MITKDEVSSLDVNRQAHHAESQMIQEPNIRLIDIRTEHDANMGCIAPERRPTWAVIGVGGGGCNITLSWATTETMLPGTGKYSFIHSDGAALARYQRSICEGHLQPRPQCYLLGNGVPPGSDSAIGSRLARAALPDLRSSFENADIVFLVACLGGGTGSGAAPVIAHAARASGARVVAMVNMPFSFEGEHRRSTAEQALCALRTTAHDIAILPLQGLMSDQHAGTDQDVAFDLVGETMRAHVQKELAGLINAREFLLSLPRCEGNGHLA